MGPSIKILSFVCLLLFFARMSEGSGKTEMPDIGSTSTVNYENRYNQCLSDVKKVFAENNSPIENFLFAFKQLNDAFFKDNPTYDEAFSYFEALLESVNWDSTDLWTTKKYCEEVYRNEEGPFKTAFMNICLMNLQELSFSSEALAIELFIQFYKNEISGQIHITHNLDQELEIDQTKIMFGEGYYDLLYTLAKEFDAEYFPSIQEHCYKYDEIKIDIEKLAIEDVD